MKRVLVLSVVFMFFMGIAYAEDKKQTECPVSGKAVTETSAHVDVEGVRIYACCKKCAKKIEADPKKYIDALKEKGITPEAAPAKEDNAEKPKKEKKEKKAE